MTDISYDDVMKQLKLAAVQHTVLGASRGKEFRGVLVVDGVEYRFSPRGAAQSRLDDAAQLERLRAWAHHGLDEDRWPPGKTISESVLAHIEALEKRVAELEARPDPLEFD